MFDVVLIGYYELCKYVRVHVCVVSFHTEEMFVIQAFSEHHIECIERVPGETPLVLPW